MKFNEKMLRCYLVGGSQDAGCDPANFLAKVEEAIKAGITAFQYREKGASTLTGPERVKLGQKLRQLTEEAGIPLIVDDDVALAKEIGADGIHVGQKDKGIDQVLREAGGMFVGYSCNTPEQVEKANNLPVAYLGSGPVFPTNSKADADPALGLDKLANLVKRSRHPIVAIGGISEANMEETLATGVAGISVISMILQSPNITETIHKINQLY